MLYRFSTFRVSMWCNLAVSRVSNDVANFGGMATVVDVGVKGGGSLLSEGWVQESWRVVGDRGFV